MVTTMGSLNHGQPRQHLETTHTLKKKKTLDLIFVWTPFTANASAAYWASHGATTYRTTIRRKTDQPCLLLDQCLPTRTVW